MRYLSIWPESDYLYIGGYGWGSDIEMVTQASLKLTLSLWMIKENKEIRLIWYFPHFQVSFPELKMADNLFLSQVGLTHCNSPILSCTMSNNKFLYQYNKKKRYSISASGKGWEITSVRTFLARMKNCPRLAMAAGFKEPKVIPWHYNSEIFTSNSEYYNSENSRGDSRALLFWFF